MLTSGNRYSWPDKPVDPCSKRSVRARQKEFSGSTDEEGGVLERCFCEWLAITRFGQSGWVALMGFGFGVVEYDDWAFTLPVLTKSREGPVAAAIKRTCSFKLIIF